MAVYLSADSSHIYIAYDHLIFYAHRSYGIFVQMCVCVLRSAKCVFVLASETELKFK